MNPVLKTIAINLVKSRSREMVRTLAEGVKLSSVLTAVPENHSLFLMLNDLVKAKPKITVAEAADELNVDLFDSVSGLLKLVVAKGESGDQSS